MSATSLIILRSSGQVERADQGDGVGQGAAVLEVRRAGDHISSGDGRSGGGGDWYADHGPDVLRHWAVASAGILAVSVRHVGAGASDEHILDIGVVADGLRESRRFVVQVGGHGIRAVGADLTVAAGVVGEIHHIGSIGRRGAWCWSDRIHEGTAVVVVARHGVEGLFVFGRPILCTAVLLCLILQGDDIVVVELRELRIQAVEPCDDGLLVRHDRVGTLRGAVDLLLEGTLQAFARTFEICHMLFEIIRHKIIVPVFGDRRRDLVSGDGDPLRCLRADERLDRIRGTVRLLL